jgi:hypothetical protein
MGREWNVVLISGLSIILVLIWPRSRVIRAVTTVKNTRSSYEISSGVLNVHRQSNNNSAPSFNSLIYKQ